MTEERQPPHRAHPVTASVRVPDLGLGGEACRTPVPTDPCTVVIMGATGDLTTRKLLPALFDLHQKKTLPDPFRVVGCGRTPWGSEEFRRRVHDALAAAGRVEPQAWARFAAQLHYRRVSLEDTGSAAELDRFLQDLDRAHPTGGNRIFYLALPPGLYRGTVEHLGRAGMGREHLDGRGWSRIVLEKPFGTDLKSGRELDASLHRHFAEHQIFRIDHYLAKETVQNILMFRFANAIFEPIWNRRYIDHVRIRATETLGVEHRAGYYESSGVLRDMFQNHMLQLLALTAMEPPPRFEAELARDERAKVFSALRPFPVEAIEEFLVLGQYAAGTIDGRPVPAYRAEEGVDPGSLTPTFAAMKVFVDNWRWQGVPFYLTSGKRLAQKKTEIAIQFKQVPYSMFRHTLGEPISANRLTMSIYPDERIALSFQTKNPGAVVCLRTVTMDFDYHQHDTGPVLDAYEKALLDCMLGDHMLFWRRDGVERSWAFLTPVLDECEGCPDRRRRLHFYAAGSAGPAAGRLLDGNP